MQDRPTAGELLRAAREFCERDLIPALDGRTRFHARVLANVLGILEREWSDEEEALLAEWRRLGTLLDDDAQSPPTLAGLRDGVRARNVELGARIRSGALDDRSDETIALLKEVVADKLAIANPRYASTQRDQDDG